MTRSMERVHLCQATEPNDGLKLEVEILNVLITTMSTTQSSSHRAIFKTRNGGCFLDSGLLDIG